jgi:hypothetical protein
MPQSRDLGRFLQSPSARERAAQQQAALDQAQAEARAALQAAEALRQAEAAGKVRGLMARLRAAVRGE